MLEADTSGETTLLKSYGKNELKVFSILPYTVIPSYCSNRSGAETWKLS